MIWNVNYFLIYIQLHIYYFQYTYLCCRQKCTNINILILWKEHFKNDRWNMEWTLLLKCSPYTTDSIFPEQNWHVKYRKACGLYNADNLERVNRINPNYMLNGSGWMASSQLYFYCEISYHSPYRIFICHVHTYIYTYLICKTYCAHSM